MRSTSTILFAAVLFSAAPALAGNLTFDGGQTTWHSTACTKPSPPASIMTMNSETEGDQLNSLISQHNAFADAAQSYMNCVSNEADRDQTMVNQQIASSAQRTVGEMQAEVNQSTAAIRASKRQN